MTKTCGKCQAIPRYTVQQDGAKKKYFACWAHMQRTVDDLLGDTKTKVVVGRYA